MPMRLWSIVVSQLQIPLGWVGRRNSGWGGAGSRSTSRGSVTVAMSSPLLQRLEVGDEVGDLVAAEVQVGHLRPGLLARRVVQPLAQVLGRHVEDATRDRCPTVDVGEGGPVLALGRALEGVAARAALGREAGEALGRL